MFSFQAPARTRIFVWRLLPELTGHSLENIEQHLQDGEFQPKDFAGQNAA